MIDESGYVPSAWRVFMGFDKDGAAVDACGALDPESGMETDEVYLERDAGASTDRAA